jgi:hypothetical protein
MELYAQIHSLRARRPLVLKDGAIIKLERIVSMGPGPEGNHFWLERTGGDKSFQIPFITLGDYFDELDWDKTDGYVWEP